MTDRLHGGRADGRSPKDFDPLSMYLGMVVEREHSDDPGIMAEIVMDHLTEDPNYYWKLVRMEGWPESRLQAVINAFEQSHPNHPNHGHVEALGIAQQRASGNVPEAGPGIQAALDEGDMIVFRTSRSREETDFILAALESGHPENAFRLPTHMGMGLVGHNQKYEGKMRKAIKAGMVPVFATPYPSVAGLYRSHRPEDDSVDKSNAGTFDPVTWAIVVPKTAEIFTSGQALRDSGLFHMMTYMDSEIVIDGKQAKKILLVPEHIIEAITEAVQAHAERQDVKGRFQNQHSDRDPKFAAFVLQESMNLKGPPYRMSRPFDEVPIEVAPGIWVKKGSKVITMDGQVVELMAWRPFPTDDPYHHGERGYLTSTGAKWPEWFPFQKENLYPSVIAYVLGLGEKASVTLKKQIIEWDAQRYALLLERFAKEDRERINAHPDDAWRQGYLARLDKLDVHVQALKEALPDYKPLPFREPVRELEAKLSTLGFPWNPETPLYHGTAHCLAIQREGFKTRSEGAAAAAGGSHLVTVSFTLDHLRASAIALGLWAMARAVQEPYGFGTLLQVVQATLHLIPVTPEDAVDGTRFSKGNEFQEVVMALRMGLDEPIFHLVSRAVTLLDRGYRFFKVLKDLPLPQGSEVLSIDSYNSSRYVMLPSQIPTPQDWERKGTRKKWDDPVREMTKAECISDFYSGSVSAGYHQQLCFDPIWMHPDVEALKDVDLDRDIGVIHARTSIRHIVMAAIDAKRLGYIVQSHSSIADETSSHVMTTLNAEKKDPADAAWNYRNYGRYSGQYRGEPIKKREWPPWSSYAPTGWGVDKAPVDPLPSNTMTFSGNEEEVKVYDTKTLQVKRVEHVDEIWARYKLPMDTVIFPYFRDVAVDVRVVRPPKAALKAIKDGYYLEQWAPPKDVPRVEGVLERLEGDNPYFSEQAMEWARQECEGRSRALIVNMPPTDFLKLAAPIDKATGYHREKLAGVKEVLNAGTPFRDIPFLFVEMHWREKALKVTGHEGRHRALALQQIGVASIPVKVLCVVGGLRWSMVPRDEWPTSITSEDGTATLPFDFPVDNVDA